MKKNEVNNYDAFLSSDEVSELSITYQSIKGVIWDLSVWENLGSTHYAHMEKYNSKKSICSPFYKNISKLYAK